MSLLNHALCLYCYTEQKQTWKFREAVELARVIYLLLTFCAIIAFPSRQANSVPSGVTVEVAERIVPWPAEIRAFLAVVEFIAHDAIGKVQFALISVMHVLRPVLAYGESSFGGQTADHVVNVL